MVDQSSEELFLTEPETIKGKINQQQEKAPFGERIIGLRDPRLMTKEEFDQSPEILYHGTSDRNFQYTPLFDYNSKEYIESSDGSQTLGVGLYTTDDLHAAEQYSLVRKGLKGPPIIQRFLPYKARMYDFRTADGKTNAFVPREFFDKWFKYYKEYYQNLDRSKLPWYIETMLVEYYLYLNTLAKTNEQFDLRVMLGTAPHPVLKSPNWPSPAYMRTFTNFMKSLGFDGLIYIEGGEGPNRRDHNSFVFYNLKKVGTYEYWQKNKFT